MARRDYLNFDLELAAGDDGGSYVARVLDSPAGEASTEFDMPFTDQDLEIFMLKVGRTRAGRRRYGSPETEMARSFGSKLYDAVFSGEVRTTLRRAIDAADRDRQGLRIRLRVSGGGKLNDVPWEYLYSSGLARFLVLSAETPVVRYLDLPNRPVPLTVAGPLRILMVVSSPTDVEPLDVQREVSMLREATADLSERGLIELDVLEAATLQELQRRLRTGTYHVLHFIGHGGFDERTEDGLLVFEDANQRAYPVTGHDLGMLLHDHDSLRLVILNACEGSRTSATDPFAGVSQSLVRQGMPAVVGMQFEITDEAAIAFSHELYSAIVDGYPIDAATADARKIIFASGNDIEWGTPVLHMRSSDGVIFDTSALEAAPRQPIPKPPPVERLDDTDPGRTMLEGVEEPPAAAGPTPVEPSGSPTLEPDAETEEMTSFVPLAGPAPVEHRSVEPSAAEPPAASPSPPGEHIPAEPPGSVPPARSGTGPGGARNWMIAAAAVAVVAIGAFAIGQGGGDDGTEVAGATVTTAQAVDAEATTTAGDAEEGAVAAENTGATRTLTAVHLTSAPVIDGENDDWPVADFFIADVGVAGEPPGAFYVDWQLGWDEDNLYANVFVSDPAVEQEHESEPSQLWRGDSIHFEIGTYDPGLGTTDGLRDGDLHVLLGPVPLGGAECEVVITANRAGGGVFRSGGPLQGARAFCEIFGSSDGDPGYDVEFAIPWTSLGIDPSPGAVIAMNLNGSDAAGSDLRSMVSTNKERTADHQAFPSWWDQVTLLP